MIRLAALPVLCALLLACDNDKDAQKRRHLARGDEYFQQAQYREAVIEYRNVLAIKRDNLEAIRGLALSYYALGDLGKSFPFLRTARTYLPEDLEVRVKLGGLYLLAGWPRLARTQASFVLETRPEDLDALVLYAEASHKPEELADAVHCLAQAWIRHSRRARYLLALGTLHLRRDDPGSAALLFQQAEEVGSSGADDHLALASYFRALQDDQRAEREFLAAAAGTPVGSTPRMKLADFYADIGSRAQAIRIYRDTVAELPDHGVAWRRLAQVAFAAGDLATTQLAVDEVIRLDRSDSDALILRGQVRLQRGDTVGAVQDLNVVVLKLSEQGSSPALAEAHFQLGRAHVQAGNLEAAKEDLEKALRIDGDHADALLLLGRLRIRTGEYREAVASLGDFAGREASVAEAWELLGAAELKNGNPQAALECFARLVELNPKSPRGPYFSGIALREMRERAAAEARFEAALERAPGDIDALSQLVSMAFEDDDRARAVERVRAELKRAPDSAPLRNLLGTVFVSLKDYPAAEASFLKAIELDPKLGDAYLRLANLYRISGQHRDALTKLKGVLEVRPQDIAALTLTGMLEQQDRNSVAAIAAYEKVLEVDPRFHIAANNLAWLYSQRGEHAERALVLAQTAYEEAPEDPHVADTLGWILYQQGLFHAARGPLTASASRLADSPDVFFHLGMTLDRIGERSLAREALSHALQLDPTFAGSAEAQETVARIDASLASGGKPGAATN